MATPSLGALQLHGRGIINLRQIHQKDAAPIEQNQLPHAQLLTAAGRPRPSSVFATTSCLSNLRSTSASALPHLHLPVKGLLREITHGLGQALCILRRAQIPADAILHCFTAAGDIAGDQGAACGGTLQQHVGHALMIGRQHHTVRRLIKRMHIRLEPMKTHDTIGNQLIHLLFVGVFIKAHHIEGDLLTKFRFQRSGRREKLVHALFLHNAPHKQEAAHAVIPHGNAGILVQIDARTGKHTYLPVGDDLFVQEKLGVLLILEEHRFCLAQCAAIHHRHHRRQHQLFKRRAQPLHVGDVWDTLGLAGCAHIDIGLDGIGNDHVRLKLVQHLPVRLQQLHILEGVDAAAVNIRLDAAQPHGLQIVLMPHKGRAENDLVLLHQRLHQLLAEAVEHIGMVGCKLFSRSSRGVVLTDEGKLLYEHVSEAFETLTMGEEKLKRSIELGVGHLKIGVSSTLCKYLLLPYLKEFIRQNPHISISISCQSTNDTLKLLEDNKIDIGLIGKPENLKNIHFDFLEEIEDIFVAAKDYLRNLKARGIQKDHILQSSTLMLLDKNNMTRQYIDDYLQENQIIIKDSIDISDMDLLIDFARIGVGVACVIKNFVREDLENGTLMEIPLGFPIHKREVGFAYKTTTKPSKSLAEFIHFYKTYR